MRTDFCSGCGKLITTDNPMGLCPACDLRWRERARKEAAWDNAPKGRKLLIRSLQTLAVISVFIALECAYWILALHRRAYNPLAAILLIVTGLIAVVAWRKAREIKRSILRCS
jgi:hypothetical protein